MAPSAGIAVVAREAVRSSRRWQTYALRFGFAALLFAMVIAAWSEQIHTLTQDPAAAARLGHNLFQLYTATQMFLVAVIAPVVVGQAIAEEREDGTLQLLTLTKLSATQILWSKVSSRLMIMGTLVLSSLPVLSLTLTFGGIGVWEAINAISVTLALMLVLGIVGGFAALTSRGGIAALISAGGYGFFVMTLAPLMLEAGHQAAGGIRGQSMPDWLTVFHAFVSNDAEALWIWAVYLPALAGVGAAASPIFRMATSDDPEEQDFGHLSPDIWQVERLKRTTFGVLALWSVGTLIIGLGSKLVPDSAWVVWRVVQASGLHFVLTLTWIFAFQNGAQLLSGMLKPSQREVELEYASTAQRMARSLRQRVWSNPVAWREIVTRGQGAAQLMGRWGLVALVVVGLPMLVLAEFDDDLLVMMGIFTMGAGCFNTGLAAAGSMVPERRGQTLTLLLTSTMARGVVVRGKLAGVFVHSFPLFAAGAALFAIGIFEPWRVPFADPYCHYYDTVTPDHPIRVHKVALLAMWAPLAWLSMAAGSLIVATRVRPAGLGWGAGLVTALGWFTFPVLGMAIVLGRRAEFYASLWVPFMNNTFSQEGCMPRPAWIYSMGLHGVVAVALLGVLTLRLPRWTQ